MPPDQSGKYYHVRDTNKLKGLWFNQTPTVKKNITNFNSRIDRLGRFFLLVFFYYQINYLANISNTVKLNENEMIFLICKLASLILLLLKLPVFIINKSFVRKLGKRSVRELDTIRHYFFNANGI